MSALRHLINDKAVGWAGALLFNERTGRLVDGHGRLEAVEPTTVVPVLVGSWAEEAEATILATLDPIAAMATADAEQLAALMADADLGDDALSDLKAQLEAQLGDDATGGGSGGGEGEGEGGGEGRTLGEAYTVVAHCESEEQQQEVFELLREKGIRARVNTTF